MKYFLSDSELFFFRASDEQREREKKERMWTGAGEKGREKEDGRKRTGGRGESEMERLRQGDGDGESSGDIHKGENSGRALLERNNGGDAAGAAGQQKHLRGDGASQHETTQPVTLPSSGGTGTITTTGTDAHSGRQNGTDESHGQTGERALSSEQTRAHAAYDDFGKSKNKAQQSPLFPVTRVSADGASDSKPRLFSQLQAELCMVGHFKEHHREEILQRLKREYENEETRMTLFSQKRGRISNHGDVLGSDVRNSH